MLFFQATDNQWLLQKEPGLKTLSRLLERRMELPRRYAQTAVLMQFDLAALQEESLDHIDRRMRDAGIRLTLGHAGKKVRGVEDGIIASLDKPTGTNVTGTYGFPPVARMFDVIAQLRPDAKRIGTIYNAGESNSTTFARAIG